MNATLKLNVSCSFYCLKYLRNVYFTELFFLPHSIYFLLVQRWDLRLSKEWQGITILKKLPVYLNTFFERFFSCLTLFILQHVDCVILDDGGFLLMSNKDEYITLVSYHQQSLHYCKHVSFTNLEHSFFSLQIVIIKMCGHMFRRGDFSSSHVSCLFYSFFTCLQTQFLLPLTEKFINHIYGSNKGLMTHLQEWPVCF